MKKQENPLSSLFSNRELTFEELGERSDSIIFYSAYEGGLIVVISCKDGILLTGVNPTNEKTIFQVFHRIGLLGIGSNSDCKAIHALARDLVLGTSLRYSKADIKAQDISERIAQEINEAFRYLNSFRGLDKLNRGPYKADFIIAEVGFDIEEDFVDLITFQGQRVYKKKIAGGLWAISELPRIIYRESPTQKPVENKDAEDKSKVEAKKAPIRIADIDTEYHPVMDGLCPLIKEFYSQNRLWTVKEAALFVGLAISILDERGGHLEMAYLDRTMLQKSKTDERRFHHIWKWVTTPNVFKSSNPWKEWRKFVAPVYRKVRKGELYPGQKFLIELYEDLKKKGFDKRDELRKMKKQELAKLIVHLLGKMQQGKQ